MSIPELISLTCCGQGLAVQANAEVTRSWVLSSILSFLQRWQTLRHPEENSLTFVPVWNVCSQALWDHLSGLESFLLYCYLPGGSWCLCSVSLWLECLLHHSWQKEGECVPTVGWGREGGEWGRSSLNKQCKHRGQQEQNVVWDVWNTATWLPDCTWYRKFRKMHQASFITHTKTPCRTVSALTWWRRASQDTL